VLKARDPFPITAVAERRVDRRRFLCAAGVTAVLTLAGEWAGWRLGASPPSGEPVQLPDDAALRLGEARTLEPAGRRAEVLVVRLDADTIVAYERRCPHLGCPVLWSAERGRFECPCHHAAFDARTGRVLFGPPRRGLVAVPVTPA